METKNKTVENALAWKNSCGSVVGNGWAEDEFNKAKKMGIKERQQYLRDNGGTWVQKYGMKEAKAVVEKISRIKGKKIQSGRISGKVGSKGWSFIADYTADKWYANKNGIDGTNLVSLEIRAPGPGFDGDKKDWHIVGTYEGGRWRIAPDGHEKSEAESVLKTVIGMPQTIKIGDDAYAWNSTGNASVCNVNVVPEIKTEWDRYVKAKAKFDKWWNPDRHFAEAGKETRDLHDAEKALWTKWRAAFGKPIPSGWAAHPELLAVAPNASVCNAGWNKELHEAIMKDLNASVQKIKSAISKTGATAQDISVDSEDHTVTASIVVKIPKRKDLDDYVNKLYSILGRGWSIAVDGASMIGCLLSITPPLPLFEKTHAKQTMSKNACSSVCNAEYSKTLKEITDSVKPYMDKRIKGDMAWKYPMIVITVLRKVCDSAVMSAGRYDGKRPPHRIYDITCTKDGYKFAGNLIVTGLLHRDDPDDASAFDEYDMTLSLMSVGKAANAVVANALAWKAQNATCCNGEVAKRLDEFSRMLEGNINQGALKDGMVRLFKAVDAADIRDKAHIKSTASQALHDYSDNDWYQKYRKQRIAEIEKLAYQYREF